MNHDITYYAKKRHTAKASDPSKEISDADIVKIDGIVKLY